MLNTQNVCPCCGASLVCPPKFNITDLPLRLDGAPVGRELDYLASLYQHCPSCGFATTDIDTDSLDDLDLFRSPEVQKSLQSVLAEPAEAVERSLSLAVCRYGYVPSVWFHMFRCLWMEGREEDLSAVVEMLKDMYAEAFGNLCAGKVSYCRSRPGRRRCQFVPVAVLRSDAERGLKSVAGLAARRRRGISISGNQIRALGAGDIF